MCNFDMLSRTLRAGRLWTRITLAEADAAGATSQEVLPIQGPDCPTLLTRHLPLDPPCHVVGERDGQGREGHSRHLDWCSCLASRMASDSLIQVSAVHDLPALAVLQERISSMRMLTDGGKRSLVLLASLQGLAGACSHAA